jgi:Flp pilus assembly protein protease CpaA
MAVDYLDYLLLPVFFLLGTIVSYQDIRYGKIKNKWIVIGAIWSAAVYLFFFLWLVIGPFITDFYYIHIANLPTDAPHPLFTVHLSFLVKSLINGSIALLVGFLIWRTKGWAAGDAKLFFVFSLLIPIKYYWKSYLPVFPSFTLLINIFIPLLLFLFFRSCLHFFLNFPRLGWSKILKRFKNFLDNKNNLKMRIVMMLGFLEIFLFLGLGQAKLGSFLPAGVSHYGVITFPLLIIFSGPISRFLQKPLVGRAIAVIFVLFLAFGLIFEPQLTWLILFQSLQMMIIFMIVLGLFRKLIDFYVESPAKEEERVFQMAIWLFFGGIITLILQESVLSVILRLPS